MAVNGGCVWYCNCVDGLEIKLKTKEQVMSKMMGGLIAAIDGFMPGYKTYVCWVAAMGMMACQMMGYHHFTPEMWGMVGITGMGTWKMGHDRKKK